MIVFDLRLYVYVFACGFLLVYDFFHAFYYLQIIVNAALIHFHFGCMHLFNHYLLIIWKILIKHLLNNFRVTLSLYESISDEGIDFIL